VGQAPRLPAGRTATGAVALQTERRWSRSRREPAEREREDSAAKSAQRMSARLAALCPETEAPAPSANTQWQARAHHRNHRRRTSSCRREPRPLREQKQLRAKFCSTALQPTAFLLAWNETDSRVMPRRFSLPAQRTHNDLKSQTMSRSQPPRLRHARWISYLPQSRMRRDCSRIFFWRIDNRRDRGGTNFVGRYGLDWLDWFLARRPELGLLDPSCQ